MTALFLIGDVRKVLASLPDQSVDLVFSSPPFLALRSYLPADHPDKDFEIGSEGTPAEYLDTLLDVVEECGRVLAPHGSLAFELGDTYADAGSPNHAGTQRDPCEGRGQLDGSARRGGQRGGALSHPGPKCYTVSKQGPGWPLNKSLCGIPELFAFSLAYGRNLLRPERTTDPWRVRNLIAWTRPNPPVGALGDKCRPATSYITVATKSEARWWDMEAVRMLPSPNTHARTAAGVSVRSRSGKSANRDGNWSSLPELRETTGAPLLDWWPIPTKPYKGAHYATFPDELARRAILLMCPLQVCKLCGEPSRRLTQSIALLDGIPVRGRSMNASGRGQSAALGFDHNRLPTDRQLPGWSHCACGHGCRPTTWRSEVTEVLQYQADDGSWVDADEWEGSEPLAERTKRKKKTVVDDIGACADPSHWRPGIVLDPFVGSGTTLAVASGNGRNSIGIDLDERNAELALGRVGPLLLQVEGMAEKAG